MHRYTHLCRYAWDIGLLGDVEAPAGGRDVFLGAVQAEDVSFHAVAAPRQLRDHLPRARGEDHLAELRPDLNLIVGNQHAVHDQRRAVGRGEVDQDLRLRQHAALRRGGLQLDDRLRRTADRRLVLVAALGVLCGDHQSAEAREDHQRRDDATHAPPRRGLVFVVRRHESFGRSGDGNDAMDTINKTITAIATNANTPRTTSAPSPATAATTVIPSKASRPSTLPAERPNAPRANTNCIATTTISPRRSPIVSSVRPAT